MKIAYKVETYTPEGEPVLRFTVTNASGAGVEFTNWGARWIAAYVPDAQGNLANVLAGYDDLAGYLTDAYYMGATVGRFANRIARASFSIDGKTCQLETNDGENTNHGGYSGFHRKLWQWEERANGIRFMLSSPSGEGGFPGNVRVITDYSFDEENRLTVRHYAETDEATYLNLTNHAYFNLSGTNEKITEHWLQIPSRQILDTTAAFIPTGKRVDVEGTPFDFTVAKPIGTDLYADHQQLRWNKGYNHCYVLKERASAERVQAASLYEPLTGRKMTVMTDLPSVLLYTAGYYERPDTAVCLETQFYPDTPSHPEFPSCLLLPGEVYEHFTVFEFQVK